MKYFIGLVAVVLISCAKDIGPIQLTGKICHQEDGKPLEGINIQAVCWLYGNSPDESYTAKITKYSTTDKDGKYSMTFEKGAFVEISMLSDVYEKWEKAIEIVGQQMTVDIALKKK